VLDLATRLGVGIYVCSVHDAYRLHSVFVDSGVFSQFFTLFFVPCQGLVLCLVPFLRRCTLRPLRTRLLDKYMMFYYLVLTALRAPCLFWLRTHKTGHSATPTHRSFAVPFLKFLARLIMYKENRKNSSIRQNYRK